MASNTVLFFGDQTADARPFLLGLIPKSSTSPALQRFFIETINALRLEISHLPEEERQSLPVFHSALELAESSCDPKSRVVLSTVLLCLAQLGDYIWRSEQNPASVGLLAHPGSHRRIVGFCTGLVPAAVAAVSVGLADLIKIAQDTVLLSLRVGLYARHRSLLVDGTLESWSVSLGGKSPAEIRAAIGQFQHSHAIPVHKQVYVSSETRSSVTVSGPPSVLRGFISTHGISGLRSSELPIFAAFHAPHLAAPKLDSIIGSSSLFSASVASGTTLINPSTGSAIAGNTLYELFEEAISHIFSTELFPTKAVDSLFKCPRDSKLSVFVLGPSNAENFLRQSLKTSGLKDVEPQTLPLDQALGPAEAIAVVGMSGRFPGSDNLQGFWDILVQNKDLHQQVPKDRWDTDLHVDPTGQKPNTALSAFGCFLEKPGAFDNSMFNMSPREALQTDPIQRLLMMTTYEALEMSGYRYDVKPDRSRIGTYMGLTTDDWREYNISQEIDMYFVTGGLRSFGSGRLNYFFKFEGPSYAVDTACSSSGAAIELACASLLSRDCDMAVAGGANVMTGPNLWAGLSRAGFVSPTGGCKTFDESADGYCRGDGVGVVVLKRLSDAIAEGDHIQGVIKGISTNHSANAPSITQPYAPSQISLYKQVLRNANLSPHQVGYVEVHGTGTQAGDVTEVNSVVATFGSGREADNPLYIGGVKANIGHGEGAAGVTSLIKAMMMFQENVIPPHAGIKTRLNPKLPSLEAANIRIAQKVVPFFNAEEPRRVLISSFGATGGNTCMVVEEPPKLIRTGSDPRSHHIVVVSAKGQSSLRGNKQRLLEFLMAYPNARLEDIAYTTTARRVHHPLRSSFCVSSVKELKHALNSLMVSTPEQAGGSSRVQAPIVFVFPGQGFEFRGLAKVLYDTCKPFQQTLDELDQICMSLNLPSFCDLILDGQPADSGNNSPVQSHLAIVALEIALARLLILWGMVPSAVIGHSLGEYAALCIAGVLSVADTLLLVGRRAQLVEELCTQGTHGMLVVQASADQFNSLIEGRGGSAYDISCYNGPNSVVVNGRMKDLERLQTALRDNHMIKSAYVSVPYAFHSAQLDSMLEEYRHVAGSATFSKPSIPVASTMLGKMVEDEESFSASYLVDQTRKPVQFEAAVKALEASGVVTNKTLFVETGPGAMCLSMVRATLAKPCKLLPCLQSADGNWKTLSKVVAEAYIGGIPISWSEYHKQYKASLAVAYLPPYHFDLKDFWIQYKGGVAALTDEMETLKKQKSIMASSTETAPVEPQLPAVVEAPPISTCLHRVVDEDISGQGGVVEFSTNLQEANLRKLVAGHNVIGIALAPSSLYKEMALGAARYLCERLGSGKSWAAMDLRNLVITSPLFLKEEASGPQLVAIRVTVDPGSTMATVVVSSTKEHGRCQVDLEPTDWTRDWSRRKYLIQDRVSRLIGSAPDKPVHHLLKDMIYKIFNPITEYSGEYQSISEIFIDQAFREAAVRLNLRQTPEESTFMFDPCWLDNIAQTAGFLLNSNVSNPEDIIFMSTGCDTLRLSSALTGGKQYLCHVRAEEVDNGNGFLCDVTVFEDSGVVALAEGLQFKRVKKALLKRMLGLPATGSITTPVSHTVLTPQKREAVSKVQAPPVVTSKGHTKPQVTVLETSPGKLSHAPKSQKGSKTSAMSATKAATSKQSNNGHFVTVIALISEEIGTALNDMEDSMTLEELGVDSLLTVSITTRLKSEQNLELPASLIAGSTTILELKQYFSQDGESAPRIEDLGGHSESSSDDDVSTSATTPQFGASRSTTPVSSGDDEPTPGQSKVMDAFMDAIASETGLSHAEIGEDTPFSDLGIDSLMSIAVISVVKDKTGIELPANIFSDCDSVTEVRQVLGRDHGDNGHHSARPQKPDVQTPPERTFQPEKYHSKVVLLQGRPQSKNPSLFLITDGGGSAAVYVHLPTIAPNLTVYAVESPFIGGKEDDFFLPGVTIGGVAEIFGSAIRSIQPHGPYMIGGYSVGGVFAFETVRYLINTGDKVHGFLLLDSACPRSLKGIIDVNVEVCEMMGLYDNISEEDQRKPLSHAQKVHVAGCTRTAGNFDPVAIKKQDQPVHTFVVWARTGFVEHLADKIIEVGHAIAERDGMEKKLDPEWVEWLESEKKSFGPRGWDKLVGPVETFVLEGDHFSIIMRPHIKTGLGVLVQKLMKRMLATLEWPANQPPQATTAYLTAPLTAQLAITANKSSRTSTGVSRQAVEEAFARSSDLIPQFAREAGCFGFLTEVYPSQRRLVLAFTTEAFAKMGYPLDGVRAGMPLNPQGILPRHRKLLDGLYDILEDGRLLELRNGRLVRTYKHVDKTPSQTLYEQLSREYPLHANTHELLHVTGSQLAECLTGTMDPINLIFGKSRALLQEFYTTAPMLVAASKHVTELLRRVFAGSTEVVEILEVGAGLGGTTKYILDMLVQAGIPFKFTYTDISPSLTVAAKQRYKHLPKECMEYLTLDIEKPPPEKLLGRFHAILSTNCIHATKNLITSCSHARKMLRPGGFLAVVEITPRLFWLDLVFGLLEGWWLFEDGRKHCLADEGFWKTSLEAAGYKSVLWAEGGDFEKPNPQLIVACTD